MISPINNDIPVSLYKPQSNKKIELRRGHLISSPDGLPDPVHRGVGEFSLEIKQEPGWLQRKVLAFLQQSNIHPLLWD